MSPRPRRLLAVDAVNGTAPGGDSVAVVDVDESNLSGRVGEPGHGVVELK